MKSRQHLNFGGMSDASLLEQLLAMEHRPNVLVECASTAVGAVSSGLLRVCREPHWRYQLPCALDLTTVTQGTLLLENVEALTPPQQQALHDWMTMGCLGVQVLSITAAPLARSVERGEFLEALFYRLNVVLIDAATASGLRESRFGGTLSACSPPNAPSWPVSSSQPAH
jgi:transcriptional regulator of aromatic amino acid metabolism